MMMMNKGRKKKLLFVSLLLLCFFSILSHLVDMLLFVCVSVWRERACSHNFQDKKKGERKNKEDNLAVIDHIQ